jgi:hypothetical protein
LDNRKEEDLAWADQSVGLGKPVYLIRKISKDVFELELDSVCNGSLPVVECVRRYVGSSYYRINAKDNTVTAVDASVRHKQDIKTWFQIWEPHRIALIKFCESEKIKQKKGKKTFQWKQK